MTTKVFINENGLVGMIKNKDKYSFYNIIDGKTDRVISTDKKEYRIAPKLSWININEIDLNLLDKSDINIIKYLRNINNCWKGTIEEFLNIYFEDWGRAMTRNYNLIVSCSPSGLQYNAWREEYRILQKEMRKLSDNHPHLKKLGIIFEYKLPYSGGKRPDVLIVAKNFIFLIEFKTSLVNDDVEAQFNQIDFYSRNLKYYHSSCKDKVIIPILLPTKINKDDEYKHNNILVKSQYDTFMQLEQLNEVQVDESALEEFLKGEYSPLPNIVELARGIFNEKKLPGVDDNNIKNFDKIEEEIKIIIDDAKKNNKKNFVVITGVPGAGKTYLGLDIVHNVNAAKGEVKSCYLSGNIALIKTLKASLGDEISTSFIKGISEYKKEYRAKIKIPKENIIIFDEGQRAWEDEPDIFKGALNLLMEKSEEKWCCLILLVGNGQVLESSESDDIRKWNRMLDESWEVACPPEVADKISISKSKIKIIDNLNLKVSLRGHLNKYLSNWVDAVLDNKVDEALEIRKNKMPEVYKIFITQDIEYAKKYCKNIYCDEASNRIIEDKRFGLICSSFTGAIGQRSKIKSINGLDGRKGLSSNSPYDDTVGKWFSNSANDKNSCCRFNRVANEYDIQGLELDMPLLFWNDDLVLKDDKWVFNEEYYNNQSNFKKGLKKKEFEHLINTYRVLLTRGRDGVIVVIPEELKDIYDYLKQCGVEEIKNKDN